MTSVEALNSSVLIQSNEENFQPQKTRQMNIQTETYLDNLRAIENIKTSIINFCEEEMKIIPADDDSGFIFCETVGKIKMANEVIEFIKNLK